MTVAAVVLAAGAGSRFAGPDHKLLAPFRGRPVLAWVLDAVDAAGFDQTYVISGAADVSGLVGPQHTLLVNQRWEAGQATSLALALDVADSAGHTAIVVGLGDQPLVPATAWRSVGAAAGPIVTATFDGVRRPPVKLEASVWAEIDREGDFGARELLRRRPELVSEIPCLGNPVDIDTVEDLRQWS